MSLQPVAYSEIVDRDAIEIGGLYDKACASLMGSVEHASKCGEKLTAKKISLGHGQWLPWLKANTEILGFADATAQRFMQFSREYTALARDLDSQGCVDAVRKLWGHEKAKGMDVHYSSEEDTWETPQDLFNLLNSEFHFELDVCALPATAKCERYFTPKDDGLSQEWTGSCWMNPPYGDVIGKWVEKARLSAEAGATVVCLVPARVDTNWWWDNCRAGEIRFLKGRLKFGGGDTSAPFPSAVVVFGRDPCVVWWER